MPKSAKQNTNQQTSPFFTPFPRYCLDTLKGDTWENTLVGPENLWDMCLCSVAQSCLTLCVPMNCSPPGSSVHRIFQTRILEWVVISFSRESSQPRGQMSLACSKLAGGFFTTTPLGKPNSLVERLYEQYSLISFNSLSSFFRGKKLQVQRNR